MCVPVKVDYGVRALVDLAIHGDRGPVRAADVAARTLIPEQYLAQVLHSLSKGGFTRSRRGPHGGHTLAMPPSDIRLSDVMARLGGTGAPVACLADAAACAHSPCCAQREVWRAVAESVFGILHSTTIEDLVNRSGAAAKSGGGAVPVALRTAV